MKHWMKDTILSLAVAAGLGIGVAAAGAEPTGTFKYAEQVKLITMDPQQQSGSGVPYLRPVYESLFERGTDGKPVPLLATGYEVDGLNVTIKLREGIAFSNGEAFNAEVAAANINRGVKLAIIEGLKTVDSAGKPIRATADAAGRLWLLVGTDSGFEGTTRLYYKTIRVTLER